MEILQAAKLRTIDSRQDQLRGPASSAWTLMPCHICAVSHLRGKRDIRKVDSQRHSDVPDNTQPAHDPADERPVPRRTEHERPVVYSARYGVPRGDLTERGGDAEVNARHDNPAPEGDHGASVSERVDCISAISP